MKINLLAQYYKKLIIKIYPSDFIFFGYQEFRCFFPTNMEF